MKEDRAPEWPFRVLRWFCREELIEQVEGDMLETFDYHEEKWGTKKARRMLYRDLISMFRPFALKGIKNSISLIMLSNYFKLTIRTIRSNKLTSSISILGLALAVSCCIVLYLFAYNILNANSFLDNRDQVYMVTSSAKNLNNDTFTWGRSPGFLQTAVAEDLTSVSLVSRYDNHRAVVRYGDKVIEEPIQFVDDDFLEIFNFPLNEGSPQALSQPTQIVMSSEIAEKYFNDRRALNEELELVIDGVAYPVTIGAIATKFPTNTYFDFDILVNHRLFPNTEVNATQLADAIFIQAGNEQLTQEFNTQQSAYTQRYNAGEPRLTIKELNLIRFDKIPEVAHSISSSVVGGENPSTLYGIIYFGLLILFIACFNYVNIALVSATRRLKEIGVRKSIGARRKQLIAQFICQNIIISFLAVFTGLLLAYFVMLPIFNGFFPFRLHLEFLDASLWIFLALIAIGTGLLSGVYPAFYISSFRANDILKGKQRLGSSKQTLFRLFLGVQFAITFLIIFSGIAFVSNSVYQKNLSWGYEQDNIFVIPVQENSQYTAFSNIIKQYPEIEATSGGASHVGHNFQKLDILVGDEARPVRVYNVNDNYFELMGIKLTEGRFFDANKASDQQNGMIVNETFKHSFFINDIATDHVATDTSRYSIVGTVEDFHHQNFYYPIEAVAFRMSSNDQNEVILAKVSAQTNREQLRYKLQREWNTAFPDAPFTGYWQDGLFDSFYQQMSIPTNMLIVFAVISILLSAIGLYGLVSLSLAKRTKEISIRKVLGASMGNLTVTINKPYFIILGIALVFAVPGSHVTIKNYLDQVNSFHVPVDYQIIVPSVLIIAGVIALTIGANLLKVARAQPTENLKQD